MLGDLRLKKKYMGWPSLPSHRKKILSRIYFLKRSTLVILLKLYRVGFDYPADTDRRNHLYADY